jgi:hypothetical protein
MDSERDLWFSRPARMRFELTGRTNVVDIADLAIAFQQALGLYRVTN